MAMTQLLKLSSVKIDRTMKEIRKNTQNLTNYKPARQNMLNDFHGLFLEFGHTRSLEVHRLTSMAKAQKYINLEGR